MTEETTDVVGRVLRSNSSSFVFGFSRPDDEPPGFGSLVQANLVNLRIYGLVYDVAVMDDPFVRQVVAASSDLQPERIEDMRQRRQVPMEITALTVAYQQDDQMYQRIPARPPGALQPILVCDNRTTRDALKDFNFFRTVLNAFNCPAEELLAASLRRAARCQLAGKEQDYLLRAGRELARVLSADISRLDAILRRLAP